MSTSKVTDVEVSALSKCFLILSIPDNEECMHLAMRKKCRNAVERHSRGRRNLARRCEINFLPVVHLSSGDDEDPRVPALPSSVVGQDENGGEESVKNHLHCRSGMAGFGPCPDVSPTSSF